MGKKGNGSRGGPPHRGRGGGGRGRGRGRGDDRGGFQPFGGQGHILGGPGAGSPSGYGSPRGGSANSRPFRGRGRGGHLTVSGQNRLGFDYSAMSRGNRHDYDQDEVDFDEDDDEDDQDEADSSIESPKGYKHKVKPHLESDVLSDLEDDSSKVQSSHQQNNASGSATPQRTVKNTANTASISKPRFTPRSNAPPPNFPEFYTSRGTAAGSKFRPPEETEDSRYLAGIPGLRRPERRQRNAPRFGDPADQTQSPFRVPVAFVKSTGEYGDPLKGNLPPRDPNDTAVHPAAVAAQLTEASQNQQPPGDASAPRHAGLGFSNRSNAKPSIPGSASKPDASATANTQPTATPYTPPRAVPAFPDTATQTFDFDTFATNNDEDQDEVNALLAAFPGSKELASGESMLEDDAAMTWSLPAFQPEANSAANNAVPVSERDLEPAKVNGASAPMPETFQRSTPPKPASRISTASSDDEEEIILVPSQSHAARAADKASTASAPNLSESAAVVVSDVQAEANAEITEQEETELGFVIDLEGEDPATASGHAQVNTYTLSSHRTALGDAVPATSKAPRKKRSAKHGKPRRIPREGDSDLDWGSDGPPKDDDGSDDDVAEEDHLAAATAGITITHSSKDREVINDPILAKAIRADRNEWESDDDDDNDIIMSIAKPAKPAKHRGGQRAKRSLANRAAASRNAAQLSRSRKADQDAIVADYMQNILNQANETSDDDEEAEKDELFSTDDMVVETVNGDLPAGAAAGKGKAKARRLSDQLGDKTDLDAMIRFMNGMDPQKGGRQLGFGDIEDEIHMDQVKEWLTESEDNSDADEDDDESRAVNAKVDALEQPQQQAASDDDEEGEDLAEQLRVILEDDDDEESSEIFSEHSSEDDDDDQDDDDDDDQEDSDDDDKGMFRGKNSWADEDEGFIRALSSQVGGAGISSGSKSAPSSKRQQKKLFHAISRGDFSDLMDLASVENEIDSDDPAYGMGSIPTARNGKRKGRKFTTDDLWAEELQQQWDKDRATKATKKQQRLMERQAAALNPFPNTHGKAGSGKSKSSKKQAKLACKAEKREMRASLKAHSNNVVSAINAAGSIDAVDTSLLTFGGQSASGDIMSLGLDKRFAFNMDELNQQIQLFLSEKGRNTMRCQPMDKFARAEVHALAAAYNLQSKSKGKGRDRFPTLIKTSKSGLNVDYRKVKRIVYSNAGATFGNDAGRSDFKDRGRNKKGKGGSGGGMYGVGGGTVPKNRDGEEVGFGADRIGADNIGHKLLAAMGWTEGSGIGSSQGMANPVSATVKTSRGGLGF
ncbi:uncharacterized protein SPSC_03963 [Sporisorium scitamineum]|uniref:Protein SQS1 n=1 Tax=Sporisorium scitamineum TaxID=49012 RepID=A0A127ZES3_9BASI|nr:uncharacterized protein SPSC_03963 [Sporisorium scitamineum]